MEKTSRWLVFTLVAIAQFMVVLDTAITNVALPTVKQQLHFTDSALQWVVTAYALTFGGFLLLGGRTADVFGRRRVLVTGMSAFTVFSFLIGISHSTTALIALRALQGMAAAFMSPSALSIVLTTFRDGGSARNKALAYWTLVATAGAAIGLLLGGMLTEYIGWRWNFFINVPVGLVMIPLITIFVPKHERAEAYTGLDLPGAVTITACLMLLVLGFSQTTSWGWLSSEALSVFGAAIALLVIFIFNESHAKHPLIPLSIFKIRNVSGANLMMAPMYATMMGIFFLITLYIQTVLRYSPVVAGVAFLPFPLILAFMSIRIPGLVARYGYRRWLILGPVIVAAGLVWLSQIPVGGHYLTNLLPAFVLIPIGIGMTFMPIVASATSGVPANEAGLASGLVTTSQMMGGALGLAILSSIAASATRAAVHSGAQSALVHGFDRAILTAAIFMVFTATLAITVIRQPRPILDGGEPANRSNQQLHPAAEP
jgi:EmrB/QacA subfamily drug resistance transporter